MPIQQLERRILALFRRIAQIQAELDEKRIASENVTI